MKKILSTALLVAAGTALASAAYSSSVYKNNLGAGYLMAYFSFDSGYTPTADFTALEITGPSWGGTGGTPVSSGGVLGSGYAAFGATATSNVAPYATLPSSLSSSATNVGNSTLSFFIQLNEKASGTAFSFSNTPDTNSVSFSGYTMTVGSATFDLTSAAQASDWVNITLTTNWGKSLVYVNGEQATASSGETFSPNGQGWGVQIGGYWGENSKNLVNANLDEVALWTGRVFSAEEIKTYATLGIPEPSAFGLLAGLGALALVASRRRRK